MTREGLDMSFRPVAGRLLLTYKNINNAVTEGVELDGEVAVTPRDQCRRAPTPTRRARRRDGSAADRPQRAPGQRPRDLACSRSASSPTCAACSASDWVAARATVNGQPLDTLAPGYAIWDAYASQRIVRGLNAFVAVDNLADSQDPEPRQGVGDWCAAGYLSS